LATAAFGSSAVRSGGAGVSKDVRK